MNVIPILVQTVFKRFHFRKKLFKFSLVQYFNKWSSVCFSHQWPSVAKGFTLLELLIVISIIAILAAAVVPNFIGFDAEARLSATRTNLSTMQTRVSLFRTKEGRYPENLEDLLETTYNDMGVERNYLDRIPVEMISSKEGSNEIENMNSDDFITGDGGWVYVKNKAKVLIDWDEPLDSKWGDAEGEIPSEW